MRIGKVLSAFIGVLIVLGSLGLAGAGIVVLSVDDADGYLRAGPVRITTDGAAVIGDDVDILLPVLDHIDLDGIRARIDAVSRNGKRVFVGIGPAREVRRYLAEVRHAAVELDRGRAILQTFAGSADAELPGDQGFWVVESVDGIVDWNIDRGRWAIAVLNENGTPGVDVEVTAAARVPFIRPLGAALLVAGLLGLAVGATLTYFGVRSVPPPPPAPEAEDAHRQAITT